MHLEIFSCTGYFHPHVKINDSDGTNPTIQISLLSNAEISNRVLKIVFEHALWFPLKGYLLKSYRTSRYA